MKHGFTSERPASIWEEGLICGNGTIGTCSYSQPWDETVIVTHEKMWLPTGDLTLPGQTGERLFEIRRLIDKGQYYQASKLADDITDQGGFMYPDPFAPVGDLRIITESKNGGYTDYNRQVEFSDG
jgi:alpha-L-fucosidase 2